MIDVGDAFIQRSRRYLGVEYPRKIARCLAHLSEDDLWWRPNPESNSVGNLLLHLAGNIRQWVVSGVGGRPDTRERQEEFDAVGGGTRAELLARLEATLAEVDEVLAELPAASLHETRLIQGGTVTVLEALYHVVEHFAMHSGQIILITKLRKAVDLGFYEVEGGVAHPRW